MDANTWELGTWTKITNAFTKSDSGDNSSALLSTGISEYTKKMNIYNFASNEGEWTLEKTSNSNYPCAYREAITAIQALAFQPPTAVTTSRPVPAAILASALHFM